MNYTKPGHQFINCEVLESTHGVYKSIVVRDLGTNEFLILTIFPNWQDYIPKKGDKGFLEFEFCEANITKYIDSKGQESTYNGTYFVFRRFVKETECVQDEVIL